MSCGSSYRDQPIQVIEGQHLDQHKLMSLLKDVYGTREGKNNFRVEVRDGCPFDNTNSYPSLTILFDQLRLNRYKIYPSEDGHFSVLSEVLVTLPLVQAEERN
jgi:hypothetical protein